MEDKKKVIVYVDGFNFYYGLENVLLAGFSQLL